MIWLILSTAGVVIIALGILYKLFILSTPQDKMKKDSSALSLSSYDDEEFLPTKISIHPSSYNQMDLRQRSNHFVIDMSNLPRPNQGSMNSNIQVTEKRGNIPTCSMNTMNNMPNMNLTNNSNLKWQKLNLMDSSNQSMVTNSWQVSDTKGLDIQNISIIHGNRKPKGVGLRGTQPLVTISRLDLLTGVKTLPRVEVKLNSPREEVSTTVTTTTTTTTTSGKSTPRKVLSPRTDENVMITSLRLQDLKLDIVIGGGGFGQVWRGNWNGTPVAVKILNSVCQNTVPESVICEFEEEVNMLARLRHPNICLFLGTCLEPPNRAIVTELVTKGTLWDLLRKPGLFNNNNHNNNGNVHYLNGKDDKLFHWPMWVTRKIFEGTTRGLIYLHNQDIIHRDLKSANLLVDDSFNVKICDFGLARLKDFTTVMTAHVGTLQWMSPEVISGKSYEESSDIYSLGIVIWETLTGQCPFDGMSQMEVGINVVQKGLRPTIPNVCNSAQVNLLRACWNYSPSQRPTASQVLSALDEAFPDSI